MQDARLFSFAACAKYIILSMRFTGIEYCAPPFKYRTFASSKLHEKTSLYFPVQTTVFIKRTMKTNGGGLSEIITIIFTMR